MTNLDYVEIEIIVEKTHHSLKKNICFDSMVVNESSIA